MAMLYRYRGLLVVAALLAVLITNFVWFCSPSPLMHESAVRIIVGALFMFLVPGLALGEIFRFRSQHPWETIALSFVLTLVLQMLLLPIPFFFAATIKLWLILLFAVSFLAIGLLAWRWRSGGELSFLAPLIAPLPRNLWDRTLYLLILIIPAAMAIVSYRWGDQWDGVGYEKLLHLMFVRDYYSLPFVLNDMGVEQGLAPPNLVNLWELLVAGWARTIQMDPLPLFFRARVVIPILGLSSMYLLIRTIFTGRRKVAAIFLGVLLMCAGDILFASNAFGWIKGEDFTRGVFAFMGTFHHADGAVDIIIPLSAAATLMFVRRPGVKTAVLCLGVLAASFLWHPREYLQLALYLGILGLVLLLVPAMGRKLVLFKRWCLTTGLLVGSAAAFFVLSALLVGGKSHAYDEMAIKKKAVQYALLPENMIGVRSFFQFPYHCMLVSTEAPDRILTWPELKDRFIRRGWQLDYWLLLSGAATVVLGFFGSRAEGRLATYYMLLWFVALGWNFSMLIIMAMTYSEFYMVTPRLLYLFSYLMIAASLVLLPITLRNLSERCASWIAGRGINLGLLANLKLGQGVGGQLCLAFWTAVFGYGLWNWQAHGAGGAKAVSWVLTFLMLAAVLAILFFRKKSAVGPLTATRSDWILVACFFAPFLIAHVVATVPKHKYAANKQPQWFGDGNPFQLSGKLIGWVQDVPSRQRFLVDPEGTDCLYVYAPQYAVIFPKPAAIKDIPTIKDIHEGKNPLYRPKDPAAPPGSPTPDQHPVDHAAALAWLEQLRVQYVLVNKQHYDDYLGEYFRSHGESYSIVFDNPEGREMVVLCTASSD